jgi:hypothetical protein
MAVVGTAPIAVGFLLGDRGPLLIEVGPGSEVGKRHEFVVDGPGVPPAISGCRG